MTVVIGHQSAEVSFAGLVPGFVGLYQFNAVIPEGTCRSKIKAKSELLT